MQEIKGAISFCIFIYHPCFWVAEFVLELDLLLYYRVVQMENCLRKQELYPEQ